MQPQFVLFACISMCEQMLTLYTDVGTSSLNGPLHICWICRSHHYICCLTSYMPFIKRFVEVILTPMSLEVVHKHHKLTICFVTKS